MRSLSGRTRLFIAFIVCLLPFAGRPWFFDDSSVLLTAEAARQHPLHPYDYRMNFSVPDQAVWPRGGLPGYTHPPLSAWALAPWICSPPRSRKHPEWPLHLFMFALALSALVAVFPISEQFVESP